VTRFIPARIVVAAVTLVLVLTGLILREEQLRRSGQEVLLSIQGVDPSNLLTGRYAALNFQEALPAGAHCPASSSPVATKLGFANPRPQGWVALRRNGDHFTPVGWAATQAGAQQLGDAAVRGTFDCNPGLAPSADLPNGFAGFTNVDIGVTRFHADQQQAQSLAAALQVAPNAPPAYAVVSVGSDGRARLKGVQVAGKRSMLSWW
jgi:hypothetical protein